MPLVFFAMMVSVLAGRSLAPHWPHLPANQGFLTALAAVLLVGGFAKICMAYAAVVYQETRDLKRSFSVASQWRSSFFWIWTIVSPFLLAGTGWGSAVQELSFGSSLLSIQIALWTLPTLAFLFLVDLAYFHWEDYCRPLSSIESNERSFSHRFLSFFWNQAKHSWLIVAIPATAVCCLLDLSETLKSTEFLSIPTWFNYLLIITLLMVFLPDLMTQLWSAQSLPREAKFDRVFRFWRTLKGNPKALLRWSTQMKSINAVVIGIIPWRRKVFLSDLLLSRMDAHQIEMILCHEAAHIRRRHFLIRSLPWIASIALAVLFRSLASHPVMQEATSNLRWIEPILSILPILPIVWLACKLAHWTEYDADQFAVALAVDARRSLGDEEASGKDAAEQLSSALLLTSHPSHHRKRSWMHPSIEQRVMRLKRLNP